MFRSFKGGERVNIDGPVWDEETGYFYTGEPLKGRVVSPFVRDKRTNVLTGNVLVKIDNPPEDCSKLVEVHVRQVKRLKRVKKKSVSVWIDTRVLSEKKTLKGSTWILVSLKKPIPQNCSKVDRYEEFVLRKKKNK